MRLKRGHDVPDGCLPISPVLLTEQGHAVVPGAVAAMHHPPEIRRVFQHHKNGFTQSARNMRKTRVDGDDKISQIAQRGGIIKVGIGVQKNTQMIDGAGQAFFLPTEIMVRAAKRKGSIAPVRTPDRTIDEPTS